MALIAQLVERQAFNLVVRGSSPREGGGESLIVVVLGLWSRGMMLALGARGREFDSLKSPEGVGGGGGGGGVCVCLCSSVVRAVGC